MASELGVDYLLEGSTTVVSGMARVTVQLIDGRTDQHIWAENYDREFSIEELIAVRTAIAQEVASRLRAIITPQEQARIATLPTQNPRAFELYQRARFRWNERTEVEVRASLEIFQEAIEEDPLFAEAHAGLADAYLVLANRGWMDHRQGHELGIMAAERALELDPLNPGANASLGALHLWSTRDWTASEAHFIRAIELDPDYAYSHYWYSALLSALGRHQESIQQARDALNADPLSPQIAAGVPRSLFLAREYDQAVEAVRGALEVHPDHAPLYAQLCRNAVLAGDMEAAERACEREKELLGGASSLSTALMLAYKGDEEATLAVVQSLEGLRGEGPQPIILAMILGKLGRVDEAFAQLRRGFDEKYPYLEYLPSNPFLDPLRDDPRYGEFLRELGF
jgi:tetratricopeptide (TPR) repeat protein